MKNKVLDPLFVCRLTSNQFIEALLGAFPVVRNVSKNKWVPSDAILCNECRLEGAVPAWCRWRSVVMPFLKML